MNLTVPLLLAGTLLLQSPASPDSPASVVQVTAVDAIDRPNDAGDAIQVIWKVDELKSPPPATDPQSLAGYRIRLTPVASENTGAAGKAEAAEVATDEGQPVERLIEATPAAREVIADGLLAGVSYQVTVTAFNNAGETVDLRTADSNVVPTVQYFNESRGWLAILLAIVCGAVIGFIIAARRGRTLWVRPIAGLEAVTDAVGRAVEMGKSCFFVPGIQDINDIQTVAGITVLSRVAEVVAEYDAEIEVPTSRSLVMATARQTVQASFLQAGRPEAYNPDSIYYVTDEQFGYVAGVTGRMVREQPAACFYMGAFFAESLILAETGNAIGAIQVAGTAMPSQLPFFIAACDYTLIGEEFFAASAYLSREPQQLGTLKGQDFGKVVGGVLIVAGSLLATILIFASDASASAPEAMRFEESVRATLEYLHDNILGQEGFLMEGVE